MRHILPAVCLGLLALGACGEPVYERQVAAPAPAAYQRPEGPRTWDPQQWVPASADDPVANQCSQQAEAQVRRDFGVSPRSVERWTFSERYLAAYKGHPPTWAIEIAPTQPVAAGDLFRFHCIQWSDGHRTLHLIDRD